MSDTPNSADDVMKLLDNGWKVTLFANALGSYTARAIRPKPGQSKRQRDRLGTVNDVVETDDFTPSQALYRLTEKATTGRIA